MLHSLKTSVALLSCGAVLSVIGILLTAVFLYKRKELKSKNQRLQSEDERLQREDERLHAEEERIQREQLRIINEHDTFSLREKRTLETVIQHWRKYAANVTLDADSAHPRLTVSPDGKQVRIVNTNPEEEVEEEVDEDEEQHNTFDKYLCVLGKEGFSSECFYYEVQVKELPLWYVGMAIESIWRKGQISLNPENGYWSVGLGSEVYWACENPYVPLSLSMKPQRVGVFVDYEEGRVSFYDVESMCHIYTFSGQSFNEKLYPVFCLGHDDFISENNAPLIICSDLS